MKVLDIALKDMLRSFRSAFAIGMMVFIPLLITGLIYAAFGGVLTSGETAAYTLPVIHIQVVNHDQGDAQSGANLGQTLISALTDESVKDVFAVTVTPDESAAHAAVDHQQAALALVIPANFTQAALSGVGKSEVQVYQDPTLSFGPGITREVVGQFLDALTGARIASRVTAAQFDARGQAISPAVVQQIQAEYGEWFKAMASQKTWNLPVVKRLPNKDTPKSVSDHRTTLMGPVMAGMLIFFAFFTGSYTAQSILKEQEEGTLSRMFSTPTPMTTILAGKFSAVFAMLIVQTVVLLGASALVFQIDWGNLLTLALVDIGLVVVATGFGILVMSFIKTTRQAGTLSSGILCLTGMVGGLFTTGVQSLPAGMETASLSMPQGWALRGMKLALAGAAPQDVLLPVAVMLALGIVFFALGSRFFSKRFA